MVDVLAAGSRLPLPPAYLLLEVVHPNPHPHQSAAVPIGKPPLETIPEEAGENKAAHGLEPAGAVLSVGCALLLLLGWEATRRPEALLALSIGTHKNWSQVSFQHMLETSNASSKLVLSFVVDLTGKTAGTSLSCIQFYVRNTAQTALQQ